MSVKTEVMASKCCGSGYKSKWSDFFYRNTAGTILFLKRNQAQPKLVFFHQKSIEFIFLPIFKEAVSPDTGVYYRLYRIISVISAEPLLV